MNKAITDTPQVIVFHTGGGASTRTWDSSLETWDEALFTWDEDVGAGTTEVIVSSVIPETIHATAIPS